MLLQKALATVLLVAAGVCLHTVDASEASKSLTGNDFKSTIEQGTTFVKFYSPHCGHCQKLAPAWEQVAVEHQNCKKQRTFRLRK
ncbi:unnamed protein product [Mortierella alpina]